MIEELLIYQSADANLRKLEKELSDSEEKKKAMSAKKIIDSAADNINRLDAKASSLLAECNLLFDEEAKLKEFHSEFKKAVDNAENENETTYLAKKIDEASMKIRAINEKINSVTAEIQNVLKDYMGLRNVVKNAQSTYNEFGTKYVQLKESKKEDREKYEKELEKLKKDVDPKYLEIYLTKRKSFYPVLVAVSNNSCGACFLELSLDERNKLKNGEIIECSSCGRLLYLNK